MSKLYCVNDCVAVCEHGITLSAHHCAKLLRNQRSAGVSSINGKHPGWSEGLA